MVTRRPEDLPLRLSPEDAFHVHCSYLQDSISKRHARFHLQIGCLLANRNSWPRFTSQRSTENSREFQRIPDNYDLTTRFGMTQTKYIDRETDRPTYRNDYKGLDEPQAHMLLCSVHLININNVIILGVSWNTDGTAPRPLSVGDYVNTVIRISYLNNGFGFCTLEGFPLLYTSRAGLRYLGAKG